MGHYDKKARILDEEPSWEEEEEVFKAKEHEYAKCPHCTKKLETVDLGARTMTFCMECGYRKTSRK